MRISDWSSDVCSSDLRLGHASPAFIHEGGWLQQQHLLPTDPPFLHPTGKLPLHRSEAMHVGNHVNRHESDIVPMHGIVRSGISKANPNLHVASLKMTCIVASAHRSEEHTSELQSLMRISYAVFCLKKKTTKTG